MASAMSVTCSSSKHKQRVARRYDLGDVRDRIARHRLPGVGDQLVHLGHELVEVQAPLRAKGRRLREQVHQHGLAAPDRAEDVAPLGCRLGAPDQRRETLATPPAPQAPREAVEGGCHLRLSGVRFDHAVGDEGPVVVEEGHRIPASAAPPGGQARPTTDLSALEFCSCRMQRPARLRKASAVRGPSPHVAMQHHIYFIGLSRFSAITLRSISVLLCTAKARPDEGTRSVAANNPPGAAKNGKG